MINKILAANTLTGPGIQPDSNPGLSLEKLISGAIGLLTIIAVIYFVIQIILTGYAMISSQGDPKLLENSRKRFTHNILGLVIVILAYSLGALIANLLGMSSAFNISSFINSIKP